MSWSSTVETDMDEEYQPNSDPNDDDADYDIHTIRNVASHNKNKSDHDDIMHDNEHKCNCDQYPITNDPFKAVNWTVHKTQRPIQFCASIIK